jgi:DNA gyrase subunit A
VTDHDPDSPSRNEPRDVEGEAADRVEYVNIESESRKRYLNYAMSVIMARALPDVRDGLKPVQRRILYVMYDGLGLTADSKYIKCARISGETIGKFHPHGDIAAYEALARMAQDFSLRYPLVEGWGNFGSVMGLPPASQRYTEARLTRLTEQLMNELRFDTVEMRPSYDGTHTEPAVLPARYPNLLVNGSQGIAVGMATNMPPHNLGEVLKACTHLINNPEASTRDLMSIIKGPDFPLGGRIVTDRKDLRQVYEEGRGSIKVRGEWRLDKEKRKEVDDRIVIHSIPYGLETNPLIAQIGDIVAARKLPQLLAVSDQSDEEHGLRIVLELKAGADPEAVMAYLYKHTPLESNFAYNATCLIPADRGTMVPRRLALHEIIRQFLDFRLITVRRRFEFVLAQLRRRIHILEGFEIVFDGLDRALKIIRNSSGKADAAEKLMKAFPLDAEQTNAILELQLYRISSLEIDEIRRELKEKRAEAAKIVKILGSEKLLWGVIETELNEVAEKFADKRRTGLGSSDEVAEFDPNAYIVRENTNVVLTKDGWIKRVGRLAKVEGTRVRDGDEVLDVLPASTLDHIVFFSSEGLAYTMRVDEIPSSSGYGEPLTKFFRLGDGAKIVCALTTDARFTPEDVQPKGEVPPLPYVFAATAQGQVLRVPLSPFRVPSTKAGRKYCRLAEKDTVVSVELCRDATSVFLASEKGAIIHFELEEVAVLSGAGRGVRGMKLRDGDKVLGAALMSKARDTLRVMTAGDQEKVFGQTKYQTVSRGGKGHQAVQRTTFSHIVRPPIELVDWAALEAGG